MISQPMRAGEIALFESMRGRLEAIAYRLLGSAAEAEDAVQDTFLRWQDADREQIRVPEAWLTRVLTNLSLTVLSSARARREVYVGEWLPEPLLDGDPMLGPAATAEQRESVSTAMLLLMEHLAPNERQDPRAPEGVLRRGDGRAVPARALPTIRREVLARRRHSAVVRLDRQRKPCPACSRRRRTGRRHGAGDHR